VQQLRFCFSFWSSKILFANPRGKIHLENYLHSLKRRNIQVTLDSVRVTLQYFALKVRGVVFVQGTSCLIFLRRISCLKLVKDVSFYNDFRNCQGSTISLDFNFYSVVYLSAFNIHRVPNEALLYQNSYGIRSSFICNFNKSAYIICPGNSSTFTTVREY